jgi:O-antigen ligase
MSVGNLDYDRVGWNDPNYFSSIIGMGAIAALNLLLSVERERKWIRILLIGVIMLVIVVSLMVASRGGTVAIFVSGAVLLILSLRSSRTSKGLMLLLVAFIAVLYQTGAFDFLIYRFVNDEGEIGGRRIIWLSKLKDFSLQATPLDWLIGKGYKAGLAMSSYVGKRDYIGFHNDFIAMLVSYGLIGLLTMVAMYVYPILKYKDPRVIAGCLYIILISMSLEPLYSGALDIFYFYFYLCVLGESTKKRTTLGIWRKSKKKILIRSYQ